jgi:hypothetical protein
VWHKPGQRQQEKALTPKQEHRLKPLKKEPPMLMVQLLEGIDNYLMYEITCINLKKFILTEF